MAAITWNDVLAHAPELAAVTLTARNDIIGFVMSSLSVSKFDGEDGFKTRLARIYLAAHLGSAVALSRGSASTGAIQSEAAGGLQRSYAVLQMNIQAASLARTSYGLAYLELVQSSLARLPFVV